MQLSKTTLARLRGYIFFVVNGKRFWRYDDARAERVRITESGQPVEFAGWNLFIGWRWFFLTVHPRNACAVMSRPLDPKAHPVRASAMASMPRLTAAAEL